MASTKIIGYEKDTMFRFNCYVEGGTGKSATHFQVSGNGDKAEMVRLYNVLLDNGFHISSTEYKDREIPIIESL